MDDQKSIRDKPKLEEYVIIVEKNQVKFANAANQYILNYNE